MRFGSVCSGIEAASVAWKPLGWNAAWFSEIEPFPSAVLSHHYPSVPNLGDMTTLPDRILGGEVEAPDLLCGGTPCQAFSVAGRRESLNDARGNLSLTFCEIADAIDIFRSRAGLPSSIIFWENVPGVLNTKDNAFGCFLAGLAGEDEPFLPPGGKWANAGAVLGPKRAVAWRILDAQYFGVAQRRRRVFVVASARDGFDPAAILFEFNGLRRDSAPSREAREGIAGGVEIGPSGGRFTDLNPTLDTRAKDGPIRNQLAGAVMHPVPTYVQCFEPRSPDGHARIVGDIAPTLNRMGGGQREPCVLTFDRQSSGEYGTGSVASTMSARDYKSPSDLVSYGIPGNWIGRKPENGGNAVKPMHDIAPCLTKTDVHGVAQPIAAFKGGQGSSAGGIGYSEHVSPTLSSADSGSNRTPALLQGMAVRRLTPVECERLQGFPDNYTEIPWRKKPSSECPDGPRYKALGNSWAVPVVRWIGSRIDLAIEVSKGVK